MKTIYFAPGLKPIMKYNPNHDARGRFSSGAGNSALSSFERKVDSAYGTGDDEFTISHTGDASVAALGTYLAKGHVVNDFIRQGQMDEYLTDETQVKDVVAGLDNAIEMAPPMPQQTVWRVASAEAVDRLVTGATYEDKGYTSTTAVDLTHRENGLVLLTLAKVSSGKKAIMQIDTGKAGKGIYMPKMFPGQPIADFEKEFLLARNTKMKYLGQDFVYPDGSDSAFIIHRFKVVA
jgi:hypothetical protein